MSVAHFESAAQKAWDEGKAAGAAAIVVDKTGKTIYSHTFGNLSRKPGSAPVTLDSTAWLASCTKLLTAISATQLVEKGLLSFDEPISKVLPAYESVKIITGFDDGGKPQFAKPSKPITLRHLVTHSSGFGYPEINPLLDQYYTVVGKSPGGGMKGLAIEEKYATDVTSFNAGDGWEYGIGLDVAGRLIEKVSGKTLAAYMEDNIFKPLGMNRSTFQPLHRPDVLEKFMARQLRQEDGSLIEIPFDHECFPVEEWTDALGGSGIFSCAQDYIKVVASLLADDEKLLSHESRKELLRPCLEDPKYLNEVIAGPLGQALVPGLDKEGLKLDYAPGGCVVTNGKEGAAGKGTVFWSGLPNSYWFIDRETGMAGVYVTQLFPFADPLTHGLVKEFSKAAFEKTKSG